MYSLASAFGEDISTLTALPLPQFFDRVKNIPYKRDPTGVEVTARPRMLLRNFPALDCKKKAILMGSYFEQNGIPYRFVACSQRPDKKIHHVFTQAEIDGAWRNVDPTYARYKLFEPKTLTRAEVLSRGGKPMNVEGLAGAQLVQMYGDPMGFSIGKLLRKTKDAALAPVRAVSNATSDVARGAVTRVVRPATGGLLDFGRTKLGQKLIDSAVEIAKSRSGGGMSDMLSQVTGGVRSPGIVDDGFLSRVGDGFKRMFPGSTRAGAEAGSPGISTPAMLALGAAGVGLTALMLRGRGGKK